MTYDYGESGTVIEHPHKPIIGIFCYVSIVFTINILLKEQKGENCR